MPVLILMVPATFSVASIRVQWPDGKNSEMAGTLRPGRYRLVRSAERAQAAAGSAGGN